MNILSGYYDPIYEEVADTYNNYYNNYMVIYYVIPFVVLALILGIIALSLALNTSKIRKKQFAVNQKVKTYLNKASFKITAAFYFSDQATFRMSNEYKKMLAVDSVNKKFALVDYSSENVVIANYSEFLNYEIYENSNMVISGGAIGGLGLGFFGAETSGQCKDLRLIMRLTNPDNPHIAYDVLPRTMFNIGIHKNSKAYRDCLASLQKMASFFEVIKNENEKAAKTA